MNWRPAVKRDASSLYGRLVELADTTASKTVAARHEGSSPSAPTMADDQKRLAKERARVGLPIKPFLYTLDQIAELIAVSVLELKNYHMHFDKRSVGPRPFDKILCRNIRSEGEPPEWRVAEQELVRWLNHKGFVIYDRRWVQH